MAIDPISASNAYAAAIKNVQNGPEGLGDNIGQVAAGGSGSFNQILNQLSDTAHQAENQIVSAATGKGDLVDVVTALTTADMTIQTVVAVRDKVIEAYREIMNMPI